MPWVVESLALDPQGRRVGTFRHWVATEERALEEVAKASGRTCREVGGEEMPSSVRDNMEENSKWP